MDPSISPSETTPNSTSGTPKPPTSTKQILFYAIGATILLVIIIAGIYFALSYLNKKPLSTQEPFRSLSTEPGLESANQMGPNIFRSKKYGWSIAYPEKIYLTRTDEDPISPGDNMLEFVSFSSRSPENNDSAEETDLLTLSVHILNNDSEASLENVVNNLSNEEKLKNNLDGYDVTSITVDKTKGFEVNMQGNTEIKGWTDIYLPGNSSQNIVRIRYSLDGNDYKNLADQLISSFKTN